MNRSFMMLGSLSGFLSVALGAFGAHGLKETLGEYGITLWKTAVDYQFYHTFALIVVSVLWDNLNQRSLRISGYAFLIGIVIFSGSLYLLALTGQKWLGAITPFGGSALMIGWIYLFWAVIKYEKCCDPRG